MRYVVVPQWQGSASDRAMSLADGADAIAGDLPAGATTRIEVPLEAGDAEGTGILRFSSLRIVRERFARALESVTDTVVTIGGDASVSYPAVARALTRDPSLAVVWFDAHPDCLDIATSETGAFAGMTARALVEDGLLPAHRLILAGTREWVDAERAWTTEAGVVALSPDQLDALPAALAATGADAVYLHIGLDVLEPAVLSMVPTAEPFGVELDPFLTTIRSLVAAAPFAGASIVGFAPRSIDAAADDLPVILRILGALRPAPPAPAPSS